MGRGSNRLTPKVKQKAAQKKKKDRAKKKAAEVKEARKKSK